MSDRPYQAQLNREVRAHWDAGRLSVLLQLGTGGGKTHTAAGILGRETGSAVFLAHLDALVGDTAARLRGMGQDCGIVAPWAKPEPEKRIQVASLATVWARGYFPPGELVIVDECHRAKARTVESILGMYPGKRLLGLTATPERSDGQGLGDIFPWMVQGPSVAELMAMGALCGYSLLCPAGRGRGDGVAELLRATGRWSRALYFAETIDEGRLAAHRLRELWYTVEEIYGDTPRNEREAIRDRLRTGKTQVLVGVGVFIEGFDEPSVDCVVLAATLGTVGRYLQAIGRGLRPSPGKDGLLILDCVGAVHVHGLPDEGRVWNLHGQASTRTEPGMRISTCSSCHAVYRAAPVCPRCGAGREAAETYKRKPSPAERLVELDAIPLAARREAYWRAMVKIGMLRLRMPRAAAERWATEGAGKRFKC